MNLPVAINKLSVQLGISSRTLRHWESEGLFKSLRDCESGWRIYDEEAVLSIKITAVLRKFDIPIKDIKTILDIKTLQTVEMAIKKQLLLLDRNTMELTTRRNMLNILLNSLLKAGEYQAGGSLRDPGYLIYTVLQQHNQNEKEEDLIMINNETFNNVCFITLPPMRTVYNTAVGISPEDEAMAPVVEWLESANLMGTARLFGGNVKPFPSKESPQYGFGMCASIPEGVEIPVHLKEMRLPGGLYAMMPSSDDIYGSWQSLMKYLSTNNEYTSDRSRLCLEEHIRNDNADGQGSQYMLNLLEPVNRK
jgi:DNA-binding transcriptional MerR regulator/DNA gyrase inhibitor GyrI